IRAPTYQRAGRMAGGGGAGGGDAENKMSVFKTKARKPYIVRRWAILRCTLQNSPELSTSTTAGWIATDAISPPLTCRDPLLFALCQLSKKYLALFLCMMSSSVPPATMSIMTTTYACMMVGGMGAESYAKGLVNTGRHPPIRPGSQESA